MPGFGKSGTSRISFFRSSMSFLRDHRHGKPLKIIPSTDKGRAMISSRRSFPANPSAGKNLTGGLHSMRVSKLLKQLAIVFTAVCTSALSATGQQPQNQNPEVIKVTTSLVQTDV